MSKLVQEQSTNVLSVAVRNISKQYLPDKCHFIFFNMSLFKNKIENETRPYLRLWLKKYLF
jgi:hypothetical protein